MIDVAIIGGGVAGCYCAYRLGHSCPSMSISLFEMSDRLGGRLWSVPLEGVGGAPAEIGGMFFCEDHKNVYGLITEKLQLEKQIVNFQQEHQYVRGKLLTDSNYTSDPASVPFFLADAEKGMSPSTLAGYALEKILPAHARLWPFSASGSPRKTMDYLRSYQFNGRPLYDWGFWNVLSQVISNEAYDLLLTTIGGASPLRNINCVDALWSLLMEASQESSKWFKLSDGYQRLPEALANDLEVKKNVRRSHQLTALKWQRDKFRLYFNVAGKDDIVVESRKVIFALPQRSIKKIKFGCDLRHTSFFEDLEKVAPIDACKLILIFPNRWWDPAGLGVDPSDLSVVASGLTDLPLDQCYYYAVKDQSSPVLLIATYADDIAASFWSALLNTKYALPAANLGSSNGSSLRASQAMIDAALSQLQRIHGGKTITQPIEALFFDWHSDPFGGAWHAWTPYCKSWEVMRRVRRPDSELPFFVCGEAFSQFQGWAEGATNSADQMLQEHFKLGRPDWLPSDYELEF